MNLKKSLRNVALGKAFVLQGGSLALFASIVEMGLAPPSGYLQLRTHI